MVMTIKMAVIGTGHWGPNLIRNFYDDPRVQLSLICDVDRDRGIAVAAKYRDVKVTTDASDIFNDPSIQAVAICTPTATHFQLAKQAILRGKHIFVEKPLAMNAAECEELIRLAKSDGVKLMVGHVFLYNPAVQYVQKMIEKDELGDVVYVYGKRVNLGPIRKDVNALWDLAPHDIAIFNYWLQGQPRAGSAVGIEHLNPPLHDVVFVSLKYPNNVLVSLHVSWLDPRKIRQIVVVGTKRMVVFDDLDPVGPIHVYDKSVKTPSGKSPIPDTIQAFKAIVQEGDLVIPKIPSQEPLKTECRHFIDCVLENREPVSNGENGLAVVRVLETLSRSLANNGAEFAMQGAARTVPTKPSEITGNA